MGRSEFQLRMALTHFAYAIDSTQAMTIIDISDSANPTGRGTYPTGYTWVGSLAVEGNYAYIGANDDGLEIVNVSDLDHPTHLATFKTAGPAIAVEVVEGVVYCAEGTDGIEVIDVGSPANPVTAASYDTPGYALGVRFANDLVYVADNASGLIILKVNDFRPPVVAITNPTFHNTYSTSNQHINLGGVASDDVGVTQVKWSNNRGGFGAASGAPENWTVAGIALLPGDNVIAVSAFDAAGNIGSDVLTVTYNAPPDVEAPTIHITVPTSLATYTTGASSIVLSGTASDNREVTQVTWLNSRGGSGNGTGTSTWSIKGIPLFTDENILTVTAYDAANNPGTATLTVTVTDADSDGVADGDDGCPNTIPGAPVDSSGCPRVVPGDLDRDGDVELGEFSHVVGCFSGPGAGLGELGCANSDLDGDGDIDLLDIARVQRCFSGANVPADCRN